MKSWKRKQTAKLKPGQKAYKHNKDSYPPQVGKLIKPVYSRDAKPEVFIRSEDLFWLDR